MHAPHSRRSSFCGPNNCVEARLDTGGFIAIRDTKDPSLQELRYTRAEWRAFTLGVKNNEFDEETF